MPSRAGGIFLMMLVMMAGAVLIIEDQIQSGRAKHNEAFQRLTGGIGFGPALDLSTCTFAFDPRLDGECSQQCGPIAGGGCFCPRHTGSIFSYRTLDQGRRIWAEGGDRAPTP
jgi:hypothetical protein